MRNFVFNLSFLTVEKIAEKAIFFICIALLHSVWSRT